MTTQDCAKLLVFLLGLWLAPDAVAALLQLPLYLTSFSTLNSQPTQGYISEYFLYAPVAFAAIQLPFVASFILAPGWWAKLAFSGARDVELPRLSEQALQGLLFSLIGVILLALALADAPSIVLEWALEPEPYIEEERRQQLLRHLPERAAWVVQIVVGAWLLLGTNGIVRAVSRLRTVGSRRNAA